MKWKWKVKIFSEYINITYLSETKTNVCTTSWLSSIYEYNEWKLKFVGGGSMTAVDKALQSFKSSKYTLLFVVMSKILQSSVLGPKLYLLYTVELHIYSDFTP